MDERFPFHRKVARLSDAAFRLYVHAICWASENHTDGSLTPADLQHVAPGLRRHERLATELVDAGLFEQTGRHGWFIHDYHDYQPSSHVRKAMDSQKVSAGQRGAHQRWHVNKGIRDPDCKFCADAGQ